MIKHELATRSSDRQLGVADRPDYENCEHMNLNELSLDQDGAERRLGLRSQIVRSILTAACSIGLTLLLWVVLVMLLAQRFRGYETIIWSSTLWLSAMISTAAVAYSRYSVRPVLSCTLAFAAFGLTYMACEGPIFGNVSQGGDPSTTESVVLNLGLLPFGVFAAAETGVWIGRRRRNKATAEPTDEPEPPDWS